MKKQTNYAWYDTISMNTAIKRIVTNALLSHFSHLLSGTTGGFGAKAGGAADFVIDCECVARP